MRYYKSTVPALAVATTAFNSADNTITLNANTNLPSFPFTLVVDPDVDGKEEIILVTSLDSGYRYNVARGTTVVNGVQAGDGTSRTDHAIGAVVKHMVTARDLQEPQTHIAATSGVHGITGSLAPLASPTFTGTVTIPSGASISGYAPLNNPSFTGVPLAPTASAGTSTTQIATTAFVTAADNLKANIASPTFTGNVALPSTTTVAGYSITAKPYAQLNRTTNFTTAAGVITMDAETFDNISGHSLSTFTERYTPNVAGNYKVTFSGYVSVDSYSGATKSSTVSIRKNGTAISNTSAVTSITSSTSTTVTLVAPVSLTTIVSLNGSSDYIDAYANQTIGATITNAALTIEWIGA